MDPQIFITFLVQDAELPEASWRPLLFCALSVTSLKHLRNFPGAPGKLRKRSFFFHYNYNPTNEIQ
jgi:hypothetical protein